MKYLLIFSAALLFQTGISFGEGTTTNHMTVECCHRAGGGCRYPDGTLMPTAESNPCACGNPNSNNCVKSTGEQDGGFKVNSPKKDALGT